MNEHIETIRPSPAAEIKCTVCNWLGVISETQMFGKISMLCPECGAVTVCAEQEAQVLAALGDAAIDSADPHPELCAGIVAQLAPANAAVLGTITTNISKAAAAVIADVSEALVKLEAYLGGVYENAKVRGVGSTHERAAEMAKYARVARRQLDALTAQVRAEAPAEAIAASRRAAGGDEAEYQRGVEDGKLIAGGMARFKAGIAAQGEAPTAAARDVLAERRRQVEQEGWTMEHDDSHSNGGMARAAAVYAIAGSRDGRHPGDELTPSIAERLWPWDWSWFKPKNRRSNLVKAGALIISEIERLDRSEQHHGIGSDK